MHAACGTRVGVQRPSRSDAHHGHVAGTQRTLGSVRFALPCPGSCTCSLASPQLHCMHTRARQVLLGALASVVVIGNADNLKEKMKKQGKVGPCIVSPQLRMPQSKPHEASPHAHACLRGDARGASNSLQPPSHTHIHVHGDAAVSRTAGRAGGQACMHLFVRYCGTGQVGKHACTCSCATVALP